MRPVLQTKFGVDGNCFSACVATILGVGLADVPNDPGTGRRVWRDYLDRFGLGMLTVQLGAGWPPEGAYCIAGGKSARGLPHAVVWFFEPDGAGKMVFDPHPDSTGLVGPPEDLTFFVALRAAELAALREEVARFKRDYLTHEHNYITVVERVTGRKHVPDHMHPTDAACVLEHEVNKARDEVARLKEEVKRKDKTIQEIVQETLDSLTAALAPEAEANP